MKSGKCSKVQTGESEFETFTKVEYSQLACKWTHTDDLAKMIDPGVFGMKSRKNLCSWIFLQAKDIFEGRTIIQIST